MKAFLKDIRHLLSLEFGDSVFLDKKLEDHRTFTIITSLIGACMAPSLWIWDFVTDPNGAENTIGLRFMFLFFLASTLGLKYRLGRRFQAALAIATTLSVEVVFVEILNRLDSGMVYGIGGFMYFMVIPMIGFQGLSLAVNVTYTFLAALLPHALALAGVAEGFDHAQYAVLIWPAAILVMLAELAFSFNYLRRYESERALEQASNTDPLTGISNRRHFMPLLRQETLRSRRYQRRISLLMLDIDDFKKINDKYGHPTGDLAIRSVTDICRSTTRVNDAVARLGGEDFAVLLPETGIEQAIAKAEKIRPIVEATQVRSLCGDEFRISVSIGVAEQRLDAEDNLMSRADAALYLAKATGRNRVCANE